MNTRVLLSAAIAAAALFPLSLRASTSLCLDDAATAEAKPAAEVNVAEDTAASTHYVLTLDATPAAEVPGSAIHGFGEAAFRTHYVTPRGLVVSDKGLTTQLLAGLVFDLYSPKEGPLNDVALVVGMWTDINSNAQNAPKVGAWNEFDYFVGISTKWMKNFEVGVTYVTFLSPISAFETEQNIEFKFAYDDSDLLGPFALHPYIKPFFAIDGDSTVVTGKSGNTMDVEIGITPGYTFKGIKEYPISFTVPTWVTVGPSEYWADSSKSFGALGSPSNDGNLGVFSTGLTLTVPLPFIPAKYGAWHAFAGVQYYHEINDNLKLASSVVGTGGNSDVVVGSTGLGFNF